jgi:hypothetical protein
MPAGSTSHSALSVVTNSQCARCTSASGSGLLSGSPKTKRRPFSTRTSSGPPSTVDDHSTTNDGEIAVRDAIVTAQALEFCAHYFFSPVIDRQGLLDEAEPPLIVEEDEPVTLVEVGEELLNALAVAQRTFEMFRCATKWLIPRRIGLQASSPRAKQDWVAVGIDKDHRIARLFAKTSEKVAARGENGMRRRD